MKQLFTLLLFLSFTSVASAKKIVILGDSITDGYGVSKNLAFPAILNEKLSPDHEVVAMAISGSTTASAISRLKWAFKVKPDIILLALGANDGLRGIKVEETKKNLSEAIDIIRKNKTEVVLVGMQMPPNYGKDYTMQFKKTFFQLAEQKKVKLIPFLLDKVGGELDLNQSDGIHPNEKGHVVIAESIYKQLKDLL